MRLDKWLWAARFFKTRALATQACDSGRVETNGQPAKPSRNLKLNDQLKIRNEGGTFEIQVLELSENRGSAALAQALYNESDTSREARRKAAEERRLNPEFFAPAPARKPGKRDRRLIHSFRGDS